MQTEVGGGVCSIRHKCLHLLSKEMACSWEQFCPAPISTPGAHLATYGNILGYHSLGFGEYYYHLVGRGQGCY